MNKVSTAVQLFWDIRSSSLPEELRDRILAMPDRRISSEGVVVIKAGRSRSQDRNRQDALNRLKNLVIQAAWEKKPRRPTSPGRASRLKRLERKAAQSRKKQLRKPVEPE